MYIFTFRGENRRERELYNMYDFRYTVTSTEGKEGEKEVKGRREDAWRRGSWRHPPYLLLKWQGHR